MICSFQLVNGHSKRSGQVPGVNSQLLTRVTLLSSLAPPFSVSKAVVESTLLRISTLLDSATPVPRGAARVSACPVDAGPLIGAPRAMGFRKNQ